jgi:hypothetical protein
MILKASLLASASVLCAEKKKSGEMLLKRDAHKHQSSRWDETPRRSLRTWGLNR